MRRIIEDWSSLLRNHHDGRLRGDGRMVVEVERGGDGAPALYHLWQGGVWRGREVALADKLFRPLLPRRGQVAVVGLSNASNTANIAK